MKAEQVRALLGQPREIKPYVVEGVQGVTSEIWVYQRMFHGQTRQVVARMRDVPYVDPITGVTRTLQEPIYDNEVTSIRETTELLMFSGVLTEWKQAREAVRDIN